MGQAVKNRLLWIAGCAFSVVALIGAQVIWKASQAVNNSKENLRTEREIIFDERPFVPPQNIRFETVPASDAFVQAARFQDSLYVAGAAGLTQYDLNGTQWREFQIGRELPASPIVALAAGQIGGATEPELILATADQGILRFDGRKFRQIYPASADVRAITAILPDSASGHLLIGTKKRGVLVFDGKAFHELHPALGHLYVQALAGSELDLWVGTLNQGVKHWHAGATETFAESEGLPDKQVLAITLTTHNTGADEKAYVGTPLGVAEFEGGKFSRVLGAGLLATALHVSGDELWVGTEEQGVVRVPLAATRNKQIVARDGSSLAKEREVRQLLGTEDGALVLTSDGIFEIKQNGIGWKEVLKPREAVLSDRNISALAVDKSGQLWVGYFDRGLDVFPAGAERVLHVEDDHVFCVNRIWPDPNGQTVEVATANGLVRFSESGQPMQVLGRADGLIADHVTDVAPYGNGLAIATPAGITFLDADGARSMYAFHGLVNNHVYALGVFNSELMVGTLGGLSDVERGFVKVNYTAGRSGLKQNWITAVARVDSEWMVGTYGSGVMALDDAGRFHGFEKATAPMEINSNAMLVTKDHVFAGTLGKGLYVYDRETRRWNAVTNGLPSTNVTALAEGAGYVYIGTDNGLVRIEEKKLQP